MNTCKHCAQAITGPDTFDDWSDAANQIRCPDGQYHAPRANYGALADYWPWNVS